MNNIKIFRKQKNLTLNELSLKTNISVGYLCHLENGSRKNPSYKTMQKISKALEKEIGEVF